MTKISFGIVFGAAIGILDGLTAWFTPDARFYLAGIIIGAAFKGAVIGAICGTCARKKSSLRGGILLGSLAGFLVSLIIAALPTDMPQHYYFNIVLTGTVGGVLIGLATQAFREKYNPDGTPR